MTYSHPSIKYYLRHIYQTLNANKIRTHEIGFAIICTLKEIKRNIIYIYILHTIEHLFRSSA